MWMLPCVMAHLPLTGDKSHSKTSKNPFEKRGDYQWHFARAAVCKLTRKWSSARVAAYNSTVEANTAAEDTSSRKSHSRLSRRPDGVSSSFLRERWKRNGWHRHIRTESTLSCNKPSRLLTNRECGRKDRREWNASVRNSNGNQAMRQHRKTRTRSSQSSSMRLSRHSLSLSERF